MPSNVIPFRRWRRPVFCGVVDARSYARKCVCGVRLGAHFTTPPHACRDTGCEAFRPARPNARERPRAV